MTPTPMTVFPAGGRTQPASPGQPVMGGESAFAALLGALPVLVAPEVRPPVAPPVPDAPVDALPDAEDASAPPDGDLPTIEVAPVAPDGASPVAVPVGVLQKAEADSTPPRHALPPAVPASAGILRGVEVVATAPDSGLPGTAPAAVLRKAEAGLIPPRHALPPAVPASTGILRDVEAAPILPLSALPPAAPVPPAPAGTLQEAAPVQTVLDDISPSTMPARAVSKGRPSNTAPVPATPDSVLPEAVPVPGWTDRASLNALPVLATSADAPAKEVALPPEGEVAVVDDKAASAPMALPRTDIARPVVVAEAGAVATRVQAARITTVVPEAGTADVAHVDRGQGIPSQSLTAPTPAPKAVEVSADSPAATPADQAKAEGQGARPTLSTGEAVPLPVAPAQAATVRGEAPSAPSPAPPPAAPLPVARQVADAVLHIKGDSTEITLMPEELGTVRIVIARDPQGLVVTLTAERPEALDLLRRHGELLRQDLSRQGDEARLDFQMAEQGGGRGQTGGRQARMMDTGFNRPQDAGQAEPEPMMRPVIVPGRLDMRM